MNMSLLAQALEEDHSREKDPLIHSPDHILIATRANLARAGHSVLLMDAGEDRGDSLLQRVPAW